MNSQLRTVADLKTSVSGLLGNIDLDNVTDLYGAFQRAANNAIQTAEFPEASGIQNISLYGGVFDYPIDTRLYQTSIVDIAPQGISRPVWENTTKTNQQTFDRTKGYYSNGTRSAFKYENGTPIIRIVSQGTKPQTNVDEMQTVGNWVAAGSASGLSVNQASYYQSPASLKFTLTGSSSGTLTETLTSPLDLSDYEDIGVAFLAVYIPNASTLTSISLKLGSSNTDYSSVTATSQFIGDFTSNNWQLVAFNFANSSDTGTPDWSAIDYVQITFNHTGTQTNFGVGGLFISMPVPFQIFYQSAAIFVPTGSETASQYIDDVTDTIILTTGAYQIYTYECALAVMENTNGSDSGTTYKQFLNTLGLDSNRNIVGGLYARFVGNNPSQQIRTIGSYYPQRSNWWWQRGGAGF